MRSWADYVVRIHKRSRANKVVDPSHSVPWTAGFAMLLCACSADLDPSTQEVGSESGGAATASGSAAGMGTGSGPATGGSTGAPTGTGGSEAQTPPPPYAPPGAMLRRLTRTQFRNAIQELTGVEVDVSQLDPDGYNGDFASTGAATVVTSAVGAERYLTQVEQAVDTVFATESTRNELVGCTPTAPDDACVTDFLSDLGARAWRRPLDPNELTALVEVASTASAELESVLDGVKWATVTLLSSMNFLYRPELGQPDAAGPSRLTDYELASRLAFLLWNSLPDEKLLEDAQSGALSTSEGVRTVAARMLDDQRGRESVGAFAEDYMRLDRVLGQAKDTGLFPEYDETLKHAMVVDMRETWINVALQDDSSVLELFSTNQAVVNSELAQVYGVPSTVLAPDSFETVLLPEDGPRIGILGKAGFLSQFANQKEGSPTLRGKFISEALMCIKVESPPGMVALELPESQPDAPTTKRERLDLHQSSPGCARCHARMDPMGLPFENFDAIGRYRTTEHGLDIDASGQFEQVPVANSRELSLAMSASPTIAECIVRKYYSYAVGHAERDVDQIMVETFADSFQASGYRLKGLILDIVASDAFSLVAPQP